ncbi:MAG: hypothetical protein J5896_06800 [Alphaproteobacteria bacterium]|nr:hypothetical protein [Alphaproteobacteria bacterium]
MLNTKEIIGKMYDTILKGSKLCLDALTSISFVLIYKGLITGVWQHVSKAENVDVGKGDPVPFGVYISVTIFELIGYLYIGYYLFKRLFRIRKLQYHISYLLMVWGVAFMIWFVLVLYRVV